MELAQLTNHHSALIDMNLELGDVGCVFDCQPKFSVADVCRGGVDVDSMMLGKALHELPCLKEKHLTTDKRGFTRINVSVGSRFPAHSEPAESHELAEWSPVQLLYCLP